MKKLLFLSCLILVAGIACGQVREDMALNYLVQMPVAGTAHAPVIILLHGYGSNEEDLFGLKTIFPKNYLVISARAPYKVGANGYQWYDMSGANGKETQLDNSRDLIIKFISQVVAAYKADASQVYLMGFSQGAVMSYEVGLTVPGNVKGIGVLSGKIPPSLKAKVKNTPALKQLKIFIAHGTVDNRIPFAEGKAANDYLVSIGLKPSFHEYAGMGHSISNAVLNDLVIWLK